MSTKYEEILAVSARLFRIKGYHATSMKEIADEVGMLKGSLYYHIESKEQILLDVILSAVEMMQASLDQVLQTDLPADEKLRQAILAHMSAFEARFEEVSVFINEISNLPEDLMKRLKSAVSNYEKKWFEIINTGVEEGVFRANLNKTIVLNSILGMCNWAYKWFLPGGSISASQIATIYADLVLPGMKESNKI